MVFDLDNLIKGNDPHQSLLLRCSIQSEELVFSLKLEHVPKGFPAIIFEYVFVLCFCWLSTSNYISELYYVIPRIVLGISLLVFDINETCVKVKYKISLLVNLVLCELEKLLLRYLLNQMALHDLIIENGST